MIFIRRMACLFSQISIAAPLAYASCLPHTVVSTWFWWPSMDVGLWLQSIFIAFQQIIDNLWISDHKWEMGFCIIIIFFSGVVIEIIMFCLIALCTKLLIESGMGGNSYLGFMYMVNELCYSKLLFDVEIQYIILESNSSVTQRWGSTECKSW